MNRQQKIAELKDAIHYLFDNDLDYSAGILTRHLQNLYGEVKQEDLLGTEPTSKSEYPK